MCLPSKGETSEGRIWPTPTTAQWALRHWHLPSLIPRPPLPAPPAAAAKPPAPLCSPAAPTSTSAPPAKRAPFYSPKILNKKSRKQPHSTGLPQSGQVRPQPTQHLTARGGCPVSLGVDGFDWLRRKGVRLCEAFDQGWQWSLGFGHLFGASSSSCLSSLRFSFWESSKIHATLANPGALFGPWAWLVMTIGISALILGLWPLHVIWTYYCLIRTKMVGPVVKLLLLIAATVVLVLWLIIGIVGSILAGLAYGFLAPVMATFDAVGEGKEKPLVHCFLDGTWSTITGGCTVVRDVKDMLVHSYFSIMDEVRLHAPPDGKPYEIRLLQIPGAIFAAACGLVVDAIMFTLIALYKFPVMLFKGWKRLIEDLVGREGPFLEAACVPFAGLAILLWPFAVIGAFLASVICSVPFGAYAAVVVYQESSFFLGLSYVISSVSIFDEYTNDVLDMAPGSCFPRFKYRKDEASSHGGSLSRPASLKDKHDGKKAPQRVTSFKSSFDEFNPFKLLDHLFKECKHRGKDLVAEGVITPKDIEGTKAGKASTGVLNVGLPAYVILKALLRSAKANSDGLVLSDGSEITSDNRPKSKIFEWFFDPLMVIKDQIKAENFTEEEEAYLEKQVLLISDPNRIKENLIRLPPLSERKQAEIEAFARRLQGITKSISRYPTAKRRFDALVKALSEELARTMGGNQSANGSQVRKMRSGIVRMLSQKSLGKTTGIRGDDHEAQLTSDGFTS